MAMSVNDWQGATTRGTTSEKEWHRMTKSDNELQWVTASESSGTVNENGTVLQRMADCHHFNDKKR